jgi:hypothetical protein
MSSRRPVSAEALASRVASVVTALTLPWHPRRPRRAAAWRTLPLLAILAACGTTDPYSFPPVCPKAAAVPEAADLTRFTAGGTDLTDMVIEARITGLKGKCSRDQDGRLKVEVTVAMLLARGPAARARSDAVDYFVAVTEGGRILVKDKLQLAVEFPPNVDRVALDGAPLVLSLPTTKTKTGEAFSILAGFQLTPAQLAFNREHGAR